MHFENQTVVVTGGAGGIGLDVAGRLAAQGAQVAILDVDQATAASGADSVFRTTGKRPTEVVADVADAEAVRIALSGITTQFGRLDGLVHCAGVRMTSRNLVDVDDEQWDNIIRVNLRGSFVTARATARLMSEAGAGAIVMIASLSGYAPRLGQSAYCVSKAGVMQLTRVLALEVASRGIRVNAVCPGVVNTPMMALSRAQDGEQVVERKLYGSLSDFRVGIPLRRVAEPEDVSNAVLYLLSPAARHVTGQSLFVDGGESIV